MQRLLSTQGLSEIYQALISQNKSELKNLLRKKQFKGPHNLDEIEEIVTNSSLEPEIRLLAYFNLIARADLETIKRLSIAVDLTSSDKLYSSPHADFYGVVYPSALFLAVLHGRTDVIAWLKSVLNESYLSEQNTKADLLVAAACGGRTEIMEMLIRPFEADGFGCDLFDEEFFDWNNKYPFLSTIYHGHMTLFKKFMASKVDGGFGYKDVFIENYKTSALEAAVAGIQIELLNELVELGCRVSEIDPARVLESAGHRGDFTLFDLFVTPVNQGGRVGMKFSFDHFIDAHKELDFSDEKQLELVKRLHLAGAQNSGVKSLPDEGYNLHEISPSLIRKSDTKLGVKTFGWIVLKMLDLFLLDPTLTKVKKWLRKNAVLFQKENLIEVIKEKLEALSGKDDLHASLLKDFVGLVNYIKILILEGKQPTHIHFADKPSALGGVVKEIPVSEFEKMAGCTFLEKFDASQCNLDDFSDVKTKIMQSEEELNHLKAMFKSVLKNPRDDLEICKINDRVRFGVFASKKIQANTVLCGYSGTLIKGKTLSSDECFRLPHSDVVVSTLSHRGIGSFFQHFPASLDIANPEGRVKYLQLLGEESSLKQVMIDNELYSTKFIDKKAEQALATENVKVEYIRYKGLPVFLFVTKNNIKAGEQLGICYGGDYWTGRDIVPEFFDIKGSIIPVSAYRRTFFKLKFGKNITYTGEFLPLIQQVKLGKSDIIFTDDRQQIQRVSFNIVLDQLIQKRGVVQGELDPPLEGDTSLYESSSVLFKTTEIEAIIKRYRLPDTTQTSLEKGLRNASANDKFDDLKVFIRLVKNINAKDDNPEVGRTALHWAAHKNHQRCYQLLLESGADVNIRDAKGALALKDAGQSPRVKM